MVFDFGYFYPSMVLDEQHISAYTAMRINESNTNSLFDMAQVASAQLVSTLEEPGQNICLLLEAATSGITPEDILRYTGIYIYS